MSSAITLLHNHGLKLMPFLCSTLLYFALVDGDGDLRTTALKCLPIVCLMLYILSKGFDCTNKYKCSQRILVGLVFSCIGDALLNIDRFPHGMAAFGLAQLCYISAFSWKPLKWNIALILYALGLIAVILVYDKLDGVLIYGLPIYAIALTTQCWRSLARATHYKDFLTVSGGIGSVLFVISDGLIAVDMFLVPVPKARIFIMITYYLAQFAITISTANECCLSTALKYQIKNSKD